MVASFLIRRAEYLSCSPCSTHNGQKSSCTRQSGLVTAWLAGSKLRYPGCHGSYVWESRNPLGNVDVSLYRFLRGPRAFCTTSTAGFAIPECQITLHLQSSGRWICRGRYPQVGWDIAGAVARCGFEARDHDMGVPSGSQGSGSRHGGA